MVDLAVAVLIVVIGAWIVVHEEMAGRGLLPSQLKNAPAAATAEAEDK